MEATILYGPRDVRVEERDGKIAPGKVFDLELPLEQAGEGYRAMDERRAIKALIRPDGRP